MKKIRSRLNWQFDPKIDGEHTTGKSMTIPDESYTIAELLERHMQGIPLNAEMREGMYGDDDPDHDDEDLEKFESLDLNERQEMVDRGIEALEDHQTRRKKWEEMEKDEQAKRETEKQLKEKAEKEAKKAPKKDTEKG